MKPRAYTEDETREMFLNHLHRMVDYWENESRIADSKGKLNGLAFSILAMLDGAAIEMPGFRVSPRPHKEDKEYHIEHNENWFDQKVDISGCLHDHWYKGER